MREGGPPNIKFFPMETERLSWLLAGVVEHQHPDLVQKNGHVTPFGGDNKHQRRSAMEAKLVSERETPSADKTWEDLVGDGTKEALERTIGARRRIASFLTKVLVMVSYKPPARTGGDMLADNDCFRTFMSDEITTKCKFIRATLT